MPFSIVLQLHLPSHFPLEAFESFVQAVRLVVRADSTAGREFGGASNLIGWRFRTCIESEEAYLSSWRQYGPDASFDELYQRERLLFSTFVSGASCIESASYACHALASAPEVLGLPFDERVRERSSLERFGALLKERHPETVLSMALDRLRSSNEWKLWKGFRNTMTHRSDLPRIVYASGGGPLPPTKALEFAKTWSSKAFSGDENSFDLLITWLAGCLEDVLRGGGER